MEPPILTGPEAWQPQLFWLVTAATGGLHLIPGLDLSATAKAGVWLFFVLSAFLLAGKLVRDVERGGWSPFFIYCVRRVFRILPLYFAVLSALLFLGYVGPEAYAWHLALLKGQDHFWTIPVEMTFYLVLLAFVASLAALPQACRLVASAVAYAASLAVYFLIGSDGVASNSISLMHYGPFFMAGVLLAFMPVSKVGGRSGLLMVVLGLALAVASSPRSIVAVWGGTIAQALEWSWLFSLAWFAVLFGAARSGLVRRALSHHWLAAFGTASFGVYLVHYHILEWAAVQFNWLPATILGWGVVGVSALFGWISYYGFEKPVLDGATARAKQVVARLSPV